MEGANSLMRQICQYLPQTGNESSTNVCTLFSERWDNEQTAGQLTYANFSTQGTPYVKVENNSFQDFALPWLVYLSKYSD